MNSNLSHAHPQSRPAPAATRPLIASATAEASESQTVRLRECLALWAAAALTASAVLLSGCDQKPKPLEFEPNLVYSMKYQIKEGIDMDQPGEDAFWIVTEMFGTPGQPRLPAVLTEDEDYAGLITLDHLHQASGRIGEPGRGLYQTHCVTCHGVTGNGRGEQSSQMSPYPRDYRKGVFKFKSTERGEKPTRDDLANLIKNGINGSRMVAIPNLTEDQTQALVDYVIYLSMRGEVERNLLDDAVYELDLEEERLINPAFQFSANEEEKEKFDDSWELAEGFVSDIADAWLEAPDAIAEIPDAPEDIIVTNSHDEFEQIMAGDRADQLVASVARGAELFKGKIASCSKCHGEQGRGDGQSTDYDDWTKEWTLGIGIQPDNREELISLLARGALPPINATPRNFELGAFHGGDSAADLYRRITQGIEGSPMPAVTFVDGEFEEQDVWHLINYIRSLKKPEDAEPPTASPQPQQTVGL